jgi:hypothetical protein
MNALSRREEETLLKTTKTYALKQCDQVLRGMQVFLQFCFIRDYFDFQSSQLVLLDGLSLLLGPAGIN